MNSHMHSVFQYITLLSTSLISLLTGASIVHYYFQPDLRIPLEDFQKEKKELNGTNGNCTSEKDV